MTEEGKIAVFKLSNSESWFHVADLMREVLNKTLASALSAKADEAADALNVARGGHRFVDAFEREIAQIRTQFGVPETQESTLLPEETPLAIL
jgi:hypothetical protein